jgi:hypothetical protein
VTSDQSPAAALANASEITGLPRDNFEVHEIFEGRVRRRLLIPRIGSSKIKLDGYRAITVFDAAGKPHIWSRNGLRVETKFPAIANALSKLKVRSTCIPPLRKLIIASQAGSTKPDRTATVVDHVIIGRPSPERNSYFHLQEKWRHRMTPRSSTEAHRNEI